MRIFQQNRLVVRQIAVTNPWPLQCALHADADAGHLAGLEGAPATVRILQTIGTLGVIRTRNRTLVRISGQNPAAKPSDATQWEIVR